MGNEAAATYSSLVGLAVGGKYEIRRVLGAGGMGVVCEAVHLDLGKRVAIKLIDKSMKESELIVTRFRREARAAGQINSEHIVVVFDVGADPRIGLYMVMEYLVGEDLQGRLERDKRVDVKTGVMIAHQIARGLAKAHEVGVIHRDLKPANVYLTQRDNGHLLVKLLDFGVSKILEDDPDGGRITGTGAPIGTPLYMAPEQAEGKDTVDGRADVWSLGAVLYEALAGAPPFPDRGSYHGTLVGILTSRPKLLHDAAPWVPPAVAAVVDAMLVHDPNARISNAAMVAQRLLDAFPTVLPDGTGHHTAVIVSQAAAAIDATGDTEVFNAATMGAVRTKNPVSYPTGPSSTRPSTREPAAPRSGLDAKSTMAEVVNSSAIREAASPALVTGAATPIGSVVAPISSSHDVAIDVDFEKTLNLQGTQGPASSATPAPPSVDGPLSSPHEYVGPLSSPHEYVGPHARTMETPVPSSVRAPTSGPPPSVRVPIPREPRHTAPLPPSSGSAGKGGVAMPLTPAQIDPIPSSMRESKPIREPPRPRTKSSVSKTFFILIAIVGVAIGAFFAGGRIRAELNERDGLPITRPTASTTSHAPSRSSSTEAPPGPAPSTAPAATTIGSAAPSASASGALRTIKRKPPPKPAAKPADAEEKPE